MIRIEVTEVRWPLVAPFTIARDTAYDIACLQLRLVDDAGFGYGRWRPAAR